MAAHHQDIDGSSKEAPLITVVEDGQRYAERAVGTHGTESQLIACLDDAILHLGGGQGTIWIDNGSISRTLMGRIRPQNSTVCYPLLGNLRVSVKSLPLTEIGRNRRNSLQER